MHLLSDWELFDERRIPGLVARPLDNIASRVAERTLNGVVLECAGVKQRAWNTRGRVGVPHHVGPCAIKANCSAAIGIRDRDNVSRSVVITCRSREDATHLPVSNDLIPHARGILAEPSSAPEGQVVYITEDETMPHIEVGITVLCIREALVAEIAVVHRAQTRT